jgi:hypothetical protein
MQYLAYFRSIAIIRLKLALQRCYIRWILHACQNLLFSSVLSKNADNYVIQNFILILNDCEIWSIFSERKLNIVRVWQQSTEVNI